MPARPLSGPRPVPLPFGVDMGRRGRPRSARERVRESLSLHVTRKRGNPHSRPLTQMTIFGNVRQWNRPRALRPGGGVGVEKIRKDPSGLYVPLVRGPRVPTRTTSRLPCAGCVAGVSTTASRTGRGARRPPPPLPRLFLLLVRASSPAASSAPPSKVESRVDVSRSTWCGAVGLENKECGVELVPL